MNVAIGDRWRGARGDVTKIRGDVTKRGVPNENIPSSCAGRCAGGVCGCGGGGVRAATGQLSPKAPERPDQRRSKRQYQGWRHERQEDGRLKSRALFLIHIQLVFDPVKPRTVLVQFTEVRKGGPLGYLRGERLPRHTSWSQAGRSG